MVRNKHIGIGLIITSIILFTPLEEIILFGVLPFNIALLVTGLILLLINGRR